LENKPKITYFYRHPQCGFSIQRVFQTLTAEIEKHAEIKEVFMLRDIPLMVFYAYKLLNIRCNQ
jgi:hypothetical protein